MSPSSASKNPAFAGVGGGVVVGADVAAAKKAVADEVVAVDAEVVPPAPPPLPKPPAPVSAPLRPPAPPPPRNPAVAGVMSPRSKSTGGELPTKVTTSSSTMVGAPPEWR